MGPEKMNGDIYATYIAKGKQNFVWGESEKRGMLINTPCHCGVQTSSGNACFMARD